MRQVAHLSTWFGEKLVVFWSSLFGAGLGSAGTFREQIAGDESEHFINQTLLFARSIGSGMDDIGKVTGGIQGAFEADAIEANVVKMGAALHEHAHQVVGDEMNGEFFLDEVGAFATQDVQGHHRLDLVEVQLNVPAFGVKSAEVIGRIGLGVQQGGHQHDRACAKALAGHAQADQAQRQSRGQGSKLLFAKSRREERVSSFLFTYAQAE